MKTVLYVFTKQLPKIITQVKAVFVFTSHKKPSVSLKGEGKKLTGGRQTVQATLDAAHRNDVQVLGPAVVAAIHYRSHGQTEGHAVLVALGTGAPCHVMTADMYQNQHRTKQHGKYMGSSQ